MIYDDSLDHVFTKTKSAVETFFFFFSSELHLGTSGEQTFLPMHRSMFTF